MAVELKWHAMGTSVQVLVNGEASHALYARRRIDELENKWSRFLPNSEISQLNMTQGITQQVSRETALLIRRAKEGYELTQGLFDPTILGDILRAGYTSSYEKLESEKSVAASPSLLSQGMDGVEIDKNDMITIATGVGFDPGGIGKGLAADLVAGEIMDRGADGVLVNIGGDIRAIGVSETSDAWGIDIEDYDESFLTHITIGNGAVATSTTKKRRWKHHNKYVHHLIDPRTGVNPASKNVVTSIVSAECWQAEVLSKALIIDESRHASSLVESLGAQYFCLDNTGVVSRSPGWKVFESERVLQ